MEKICRQLEELLSDISFCGIMNISADMYGNIKYISANMKDIGMKAGSEMLDRFYDEISGFRIGENDGSKAVALIFSLEFYMQNVLNV